MPESTYPPEEQQRFAARLLALRRTSREYEANAVYVLGPLGPQHYYHRLMGEERKALDRLVDKAEVNIDLPIPGEDWQERVLDDLGDALRSTAGPALRARLLTLLEDTNA